jgi:hypothetical protein
LVTRNEKDFGGIEGLVTCNPFKESFEEMTQRISIHDQENKNSSILKTDQEKNET